MRFGRALVAVLLAGMGLPAHARAHPGAGIVVDRAGNVYFVVIGRNTIMRLEPGGRAAPFVTDERLRLPHHLTLARDGTLYVASDHDGRVWRVDDAGRLRPHFSSDDIRRAPVGAAPMVGGGGDPFTVDSAGNVYGLASPTGNSIARFTPGGVMTPIAPAARFGLLHFRSMAWGPDGALYLTDATGVWRIRGDSAAFVNPSPPLAQPVGVAVDDSGNVYVADYLLGVVRFDRNGRVNTPAALAALRAGHPVGVTLAGGAVYVLNASPFTTSIWRVADGRAARLHVTRERQYYLRWVLPVALLLLLGLVVLRSVQRVRTARVARAAAPAK